MGLDREQQVAGYTYLLVRWNNAPPGMPAEMWSELDDERSEIRKVEVWSDGRVGYAVGSEEVGGTRLSISPIPSVEDISAQLPFEPIEISEAEFEARWQDRRP